MRLFMNVCRKRRINFCLNEKKNQQLNAIKETLRHKALKRQITVSDENDNKHINSFSEKRKKKKTNLVIN